MLALSDRSDPMPPSSEKSTDPCGPGPARCIRPRRSPACRRGNARGSGARGRRAPGRLAADKGFCNWRARRSGGSCDAASTSAVRKATLRRMGGMHPAYAGQPRPGCSVLCAKCGARTPVFARRIPGVLGLDSAAGEPEVQESGKSCEREHRTLLCLRDALGARQCEQPVRCVPGQGARPGGGVAGGASRVLEH